MKNFRLFIFTNQGVHLKMDACCCGVVVSVDKKAIEMPSILRNSVPAKAVGAKNWRMVREARSKTCRKPETQSAPALTRSESVKGDGWNHSRL